MTKRKKFFVWTGIASGLFFAFLIIFAFFEIARWRLDNKIEELKKSGEPLCLADFYHKSSSLRKNGAIYLLQAKEELHSVVSEVYERERYVELGSIRIDDSDSINLPKIYASINNYPDIYPLLEKADTCPEIIFTYDYLADPHDFSKEYQSYLELKTNALKFLLVNTDGLLKERQNNAAFQTAILMLRLSRRFGSDNLTMFGFLNYFVNSTRGLNALHQVLLSTPLSEDRRDIIDRELSLYNPLDSYRSALKFERVFVLNDLKYQQSYFKSVEYRQLLAIKIIEDFNGLSKRPDFAQASMPFDEYPDSTFIGMKGDSSLLVTNLKVSLNFAFQHQALMRSLRIINAMQRKKWQSNAAPSMEDLGLPKDIGVDPFNSQPFIMKKTDESWMIYSVGANLVDDGGQFIYNTDVGYPMK